MKKKYTELKKISYLNNKGVTMVAAIIIMVILVVFTFALTLVAYTLYASQNKNVASMRCSEAANTLSTALVDELTYTDDTQGHCPEKDSYLYRYIRYNLCQDHKTWPYYVSDVTENHTKEEAYRYFDLLYRDSKKETVKPENGGTPIEQQVDGVEGLPGRTIVCIYWELPKDSSVTSDKTAKEKLTNKDGIKLYIEVTCEVASQSYTVTKELILKTSSYIGTDADKGEYLKDALEKDGNAFTNPCKFTESEFNFGEKWEWKKPYEN